MDRIAGKRWKMRENVVLRRSWLTSISMGYSYYRRVKPRPKLPALKAFTAAQVVAKGFAASTIRRMSSDGRLIELSRGVYMDGATDPSYAVDILTVAARVPSAVFNLWSALDLLGLAPVAATAISIGVRSDSRTPRLNWPPIHVSRLSIDRLREGIEVMQIGNVNITVTTPARTVADCFAIRGVIGLGVCVEALLESRRRNLATLPDIWRFAQTAKVVDVVRPYLEVIE